MRPRYVLTSLFLFSLLLLAVQTTSCNKCWGSIHLSAGVPQAVRPGDRVEFHGRIEGGCECGGWCSLGVSCFNGQRTYTDSSSTYKRGYCTVNDVPGGEFYVEASGSCSGPACGPGDIPGSTGPLSAYSGRAYIVSVPSFSASANPTSLPKQGIVVVRATELSSIDDGKGTLSVMASFGGKSYTLSRSSRGNFEGTINYDLRNTPAGRMTIEVVATKSYAGVTDSEGKIVNIMLQGSKPRINANLPSTLRRGDRITVEVEEPDGDDVVAKLRIAGRLIELSRGTNEVTLDVPKGDYTLSVEASDVDGSHSESYSVRVIGFPPSVNINVASELKRGDRITVEVEEPDGDDIDGTLTIGDKTFKLNRGKNALVAPADLRAGEYAVLAVAKDSDGEGRAETSFRLINREPDLRVSVDKGEVRVGEAIRISVEASDDAPNLMVRTQVGGTTFEGTGTFNYIPGNEGNLKVRSIATDIDGASVEATLEIEVRGIPSSQGFKGSGDSGGSSSGLGGFEVLESSNTSGSSTLLTEATMQSSTNATTGEGSRGALAPNVPPKPVSVIIEVTPPEPRVGDVVRVRVITNARGTLQVLDPEGNLIVDTARLQSDFRVNKSGSWLAKFIYKEGSRVKVVSRSFSVHAENVNLVEPAAVRTVIRDYEPIRSFEPACITVKRSQDRFPWIYLTVTILLSLLIVRRRVSG